MWRPEVSWTESDRWECRSDDTDALDPQLDSTDHHESAEKTTRPTEGGATGRSPSPSPSTRGRVRAEYAQPAYQDMGISDVDTSDAEQRFFSLTPPYQTRPGPSGPMHALQPPPSAHRLNRRFEEQDAQRTECHSRTLEPNPFTLRDILEPLDEEMDIADQARSDKEPVAPLRIPRYQTRAGSSHQMNALQAPPTTRSQTRSPSPDIVDRTYGKRAQSSDDNFSEADISSGEDTSDGEFVIARPQHGRPRRAAALRAGALLPRHAPKPPKVATRRTKERRRATVTLSPSSLQRVRAEHVLFLKGKWEPLVHDVLRPVKAKHLWECVECGQGCAREAEGARHMLTHHNVRWLCGNPECGQVFARKDAVKRHLKETRKCRDKITSGTTVDTETPMVIINEQKDEDEGIDDVTLVRIRWVEAEENNKHQV
jgi:hypothetical protein